MLLLVFVGWPVSVLIEAREQRRTSPPLEEESFGGVMVAASLGGWDASWPGALRFRSW